MPLYVMLLMALAVDAAKNLDNQSFLKKKKRKKKVLEILRYGL